MNNWQSKMSINHNINSNLNDDKLMEVANAYLPMENTIYGLSKFVKRPFTTVEEKWGEEGQHQYIIHPGEWDMDKGR